jgi:hypothetical protein
MTNEEFFDLWCDDGLESVSKELDNSWRHGNNVEEVYLDPTTNKYWKVFYRVSGDGECHGIRDREFDIFEVMPIKKMVEVTEYVKIMKGN